MLPHRSSLVATVSVGLFLAAAGAPTAIAAQAPTVASCTDAGAAHVDPGDDVVAALDRAPTSATICFGPGVYRLTEPLRPRTGQTLVGERATLSGSRVLRAFTRTAHGWSVGGQTQQGERTGTCEHGVACRFPDDVLRDGVPLQRVLSASAVGAGCYWFDYAGDRIVVGDDPAGHVVEAMVAPAAVLSRDVGGADVTVRGFTVEEFATRAQHGAIETAAPGWRITGNVVQVNHGAGITSQGNVVIDGNAVLRNGQLGIGGTGRHTTVTANEIAFNNTGGFSVGWEAGGAKWALTDGLDVERNDVHDNQGPGLWTDIDARDTTYAGNTVSDNAGPGIFHEISGSATVRDNVVTGNGHGSDTWLWGSGILLAASHDVRVVGNRLAGNASGIGLIQQDRGDSEVDGRPRTLHDIAVSQNRVAMNGGSSGGVTDSGFDAMFTDPTITWRGNAWTGSAGTPFAWDDRDLTASQWRALGHDVDGTFH